MRTVKVEIPRIHIPYLMRAIHESIVACAVVLSKEHDEEVKQYTRDVMDSLVISLGVIEEEYYKGLVKGE